MSKSDNVGGTYEKRKKKIFIFGFSYGDGH